VADRHRRHRLLMLHGVHVDLRRRPGRGWGAVRGGVARCRAAVGGTVVGAVWQRRAAGLGRPPRRGAAHAGGDAGARGRSRCLTLDFVSFFWKITMPSIREYRVLSLPRAVLSPSYHCGAQGRAAQPSCMPRTPACACLGRTTARARPMLRAG
jgi:hypothetical protein